MIFLTTNKDFYPRSPRGERRVATPASAGEAGISIHAPREGSDRLGAHRLSAGLGDFYPRSPRGERLELLQRLFVAAFISIHAPREGSDRWPAC